MSGIRILALTLLATGTLLHGNDADAQARQPPQWNYEADPPVELDIWLRRLVGRFSFDGLVHVPGNGECGAPGSSVVTQPCQAIKGTADCVSVGTGPGVQCVFNVSWLDIWTVDFETGSVVPAAVSYLNPAMAQFGLDPGKAEINHLLVDNKGLPEGGLGASTGKPGDLPDILCEPARHRGRLRTDLPHRSQSRRPAPVHVDRRREGTEGHRLAVLQHHIDAAPGSSRAGKGLE